MTLGAVVRWRYFGQVLHCVIIHEYIGSIVLLGGINAVIGKGGDRDCQNAKTREVFLKKVIIRKFTQIYA